ncbi:MAG: hypothetical protein RMK20_02855 [Verrucomicrobiales bacterium]|nr:hypothetical protein [Verrucomicrobiales bacterium]
MSLVIGGSPNNRTVSYNGLTSNRLYHAAIRLVESGQILHQRILVRHL